MQPPLRDVGITTTMPINKRIFELVDEIVAEKNSTEKLALVAELKQLLSLEDERRKAKAKDAKA